MKIYKLNISRHERNLLKQRFRPPPELYYVLHGRTIHAEHYSKRYYGTTHTKRKYIEDESLRREIIR